MKAKLSLLLVAGLCVPALAQEPASLSVTVRDAGTGQLTPCTLRIVDSAGQDLTKNQALSKGLRSNGTFQRQLPPGRFSIRVVRGFETAGADREVTLEPGESKQVDIQIERVVDLRKSGWYSGDSHAHMIHGERDILVSFDDVALAARAEDLQYLSLSHAWNLPDATPESLSRELRQRSTSDCLLTWNVEAPKNYYKGDAGRCLGHCWNLGLESGYRRPQDNPIELLLEASAHDYESEKPSYANFESHLLIHSLRAKVFYTHPLRFWMGPWGGQGIYPRQERMRVSNMAVELPLDVLVGPTFDGMDVITGSGEVESDEKAFKLWSMLLNRGYRLAATGSSDSCFDRPGGAVPGATRTYTYLKNGFTLEAVAEATAAGRTFVTTGPLLLVSLDGQPTGSQVHADGSARTLAVEVWASGEDPGDLAKLEIIRNGSLWKEITLTGRHQQLTVPITEAAGAWYCARVYGRDAKRQRAITGAFFLNPPGFLPPSPTKVTARVRIVDARSGEALSGIVDEVYQLGPSLVKGVRSHDVDGEALLTIPGTARLRVSAPGYRPLTLSPFLDNPDLVKLVTTLSADELLDWATFERIREMLGKVELTFKLERQGDKVTR